MALAFERQAKESEKAFAAFSIYLSLGPERSLAKVAGKLGRSKVMMEKWSRRWDWQGRLVAYAAHMALVEREAAEAMTRVKAVDWAKRYQELREAEWQERQNLVEFAAEVRQRWMAKAERCGTLDGYARLLELASQLGHRACEKDLAVGHRLEVTGADGGPIRVEIEAALKKVYGGVDEPREKVLDVEATELLSKPDVNEEGGNSGAMAGGGVATNLRAIAAHLTPSSSAITS